MLICAALLAGSQASATGEVLGTWASPPDDKGQTGHVVLAPCGADSAGYCGTLVRAFDPEGRPIVTPNVGKRLLFDIRPAAGAGYAGRAYVPAFGAEFPARIEVEGDVLEVRGCAVGGVVCREQRWARID
jgi:uncharacterized protein (DUF2147 family)